MARTLYDKLWDAHLVRDNGDGTALVYIDRHLVHEVTSPQAFDGLRLAGRKPWRIDANLAVADHNVPTTDRSRGIADPISRTQVDALDANCAEFGITEFRMSDLRQELLDIFVCRATKRYGLSGVNQLQHALQCAAHAEADDAPPATVLACLLHDVGHMIHTLGENPAGRGVDDVHEQLGADWLAERFGPDVSEPVRLHVAAKRYLCATDPTYFGKLSAASVHTLSLQGGPMQPREIAEFERHPFYREAVRVRLWDEGGKTPGVRTPPFSHYVPLLQRVVDRHVGPQI